MEEHGISEQMLPPHSVRGGSRTPKNAMIPPQRFAQMATDFAGERIAKVYRAPTRSGSPRAAPWTSTT